MSKVNSEQVRLTSADAEALSEAWIVVSPKSRHRILPALIREFERILAERVTQVKAEDEWLVETLESTVASLRGRLDAVCALADHWADDPHALLGIRNAGEVVAYDLRQALAGYVPGSIRVAVCTCECSPPEFGGSLPDRDCQTHSESSIRVAGGERDE